MLAYTYCSLSSHKNSTMRKVTNGHDQVRIPKRFQPSNRGDDLPTCACRLVSGIIYSYFQ